MARGENKLVLVLRLLDLIQRRKHGVTYKEMMLDLGSSKSSVLRYVDLLEQSGVPLERRHVGDELRIVIAHGEDWRHRPSTAELFVLASGRLLLQGLEGIDAVKWVDRRLKTRRPAISMEAALPHDPKMAQAIEQALTEEHRLRVMYRGVKDAAPKPRVVEPLELRFSARAWYLFAFDVDKAELRTFKLARFESAQVLPDKNTRSAVDAAPDPHQVGVWQSSDRHDVVVRVFDPAARFVAEYPLNVSQRVEPHDDGTATVRARVTGLEEVTRWVLRWGGDAQVLEPPALVDRVTAEVTRAAGRYR